MRAEDDDAGTFGDLQFMFSDADVDKPFNITTAPGGSGHIFTTEVLDFEEFQSYELTVIVMDMAAVESERR